METEIIRKLRLKDDFFVRNPAQIYGKEVVFENWKLKLTKEEFQQIYDRLFWGCGACCGVGSVSVREKGEYVEVEGIPCVCHTGWFWSLTI
jgi:hypothetical protein